jgi:hypothetical protein
MHKNMQNQRPVQQITVLPALGDVSAFGKRICFLVARVGLDSFVVLSNLFSFPLFVREFFETAYLL